VAGSKKPAGGQLVIGVVKETVERGTGRVVGPVGVVVSALDTLVDEGEVLIWETYQK
jgi:hypothetical protein